MSPYDFFLDNHISDHIVRTFYCMNFTLFILFAAKYTIQDNFITPTGNKYNRIVYLVSGFGVLFQIYRIYFQERLNKTIILEAIFFYRIIYYCFSLIALCYVNLTRSYTNILLVLKIQKINNSICKNENIDNTTLWNVLFYLVISIRVLLMIITYILTPNYNISDVGSNIIFLSFDANYFYSIRILNLLRKYLKAWNNAVKETNDVLGYDEYYKEFFEVYQNILKAFQLFKDAFQLLVIFLLNIYSILTY